MSNKSEATFHNGEKVEQAIELGTADPQDYLQQARIRELNALGQGSIVPDEPAYDPSFAPEQETIGDWAGHTPDPAVGIVPDGQLISFGIEALVRISGENSRDHGFHDDWPVKRDELANPGFERQLSLAIVEKIALIHEEVSESLGEIRSGRHPLEIYFADKKGLIGPKDNEYPHQIYGAFVEGELVSYGSTRYSESDIPLLKPEGFLVEIADAIIRSADLAYLVDGKETLIEALHAKHEYNATRPFKHGRKF